MVNVLPSRYLPAKSQQNHYNKKQNLFKVENKEKTTDMVLVFLSLTNEQISQLVLVFLLLIARSYMPARLHGILSD